MKLLLGMLVGAVLACVAVARADPFGGLWWEAHTAADGVNVRRMRDAESGVVCYVASGHQGSRDLYAVGRHVAISCIAPTKGESR